MENEMYKKIKKIRNIFHFWLAFSLIISLAVLFRTPASKLAIGTFFINLLALGSYYLVILLNLNQKKHSFSKTRLILIIVLFSVFFLILFKLYFLYSANSLFELSAKDSLEYDEKARFILEKGAIHGLKALFITTELADFGAIISVALAYYVYPSPIAFNLLNIILGVVTALSMYNLLTRLLANNQIAFICALSYALSSFNVYLYSTGMKETVFVLMVTLFFEKMHKFNHENNLWELLQSVVFLFSLLLFRPAVFVLALISVPIGYIFARKISIKSLFLLLVLLFGAFANLIFFNDILESFTILTDPKVVEEKQILSATKFNYFAAFLSSVVGPFPTYHPLVNNEQQSFYSLGLAFRVLLTGFFVNGLYIGFKRKETIILTMGFFILGEMIILASILQSFELRLTSPHLAALYVIAFYGIFLERDTARVKVINLVVLLISTMLMLFWNARI